LKGDRDTGCNGRTYINSFYTTSGIETFTKAMAASGKSIFYGENYDEAVTSECFTPEEEQSNSADNGGDGNNNGIKINPHEISYGFGCSAGRQKGRFVLQSFRGQMCDGNDVVEVVDELDSLNKEIRQISCENIYNSEDYVDNEKNGDNSNDNIENPISLLIKSRSCNIRDEIKSCPDPFGKLKRYSNKLDHALGLSRPRIFFYKTTLRLLSVLLCSIGIIFFVSARLLIFASRLKEREMAKKNKYTANKNKSQVSNAANKNKNVAVYDFWDRVNSIKKIRREKSNQTKGIIPPQDLELSGVLETKPSGGLASTMSSISSLTHSLRRKFNIAPFYVKSNTALSTLSSVSGISTMVGIKTRHEQHRNNKVDHHHELDKNEVLSAVVSEDDSMGSHQHEESKRQLAVDSLSKLREDESCYMGRNFDKYSLQSDPTQQHITILDTYSGDSGMGKLEEDDEDDEDEGILHKEEYNEEENEDFFDGEYHGEDEGTFDGEYHGEDEQTFNGEYHNEEDDEIIGEDYNDDEEEEILDEGSQEDYDEGYYEEGEYPNINKKRFSWLKKIRRGMNRR